MSEHVSIRPFTEADFTDIIAIANKRFGNEYLNLNDLQDYMNNGNKIGVVAISNNEIAGFALAQICNFDEAMAIILCEHDWFQEQFANKQSIGVLKMIAVNHKYSNQGIGTSLTKHRIEILKKSTNSIFAVSWEHKQDIQNTKILQKFGLTLKRKIENYWKEDSLDKGYSCEQCVAPPCKCCALIYVM